jgi:hypothetical protein
MAGVFQNIAPIPLTARRVYLPPLVRGEDTLARGFNIFEDVRHSSVLYVCKYFVVLLLLSSIILGISKRYYSFPAHLDYDSLFL